MKDLFHFALDCVSEFYKCFFAVLFILMIFVVCIAPPILAFVLFMKWVS